MTFPVVEAIEVVYDGWTRMKLATLLLVSGTRVKRHVEDHGPSTCVLPYDPERKCALLVSMARAPVLVAGSPAVLEVPAGRIEHGSPEQSARAEAIEECGVLLKTLEFAMCAWTMPAISAERSHMYLAEYQAADRIAPGGGVAAEGEEIEVVELSLDELWIRLKCGKLPDLKTAFLLQHLRLKRPDLFSGKA